ncbi:receptor-like protein 6 [Camellia sinensis]|uniref:receptor-like protein 6 n=1 Tax=Camellia sinensis TaxID=4442 RepID=UPI001035CEEA|nr:receptor-like protein 6 [Camellia sinensis]
MYSKCGDIDSARYVFDRMMDRDRTCVSWTAIIGGYAEKGDLDEALALFHSMQAAGQTPDGVVNLILILKQCSGMRVVIAARGRGSPMTGRMGILCYCQLHGKFSKNIFHLPNLRELNKGGNKDLTGKLPYFNVTSSFQFLDLSGTSFLGQLLDLINNLKALNSLYLYHCNFSGSIPASLGNLTQITNLDFEYNSFGSQIPSSISNLAKLNPLYLDRNKLNGKIPNSLGNMSQLTHLYLSSNHLTGTIPSLLFALPSLVYIDLSNNKLQGPIPGLVYELHNLTGLGLSSNNFSGVVELDKLLNLKHLSNLDLAYNGLSLNVNNSVNSTLTNFDTRGLASCNLSEFPNFLREQVRLRSLDLSNNKIPSEVPKWLFNVRKDSLYNLNLSHNFLTSLERLSWKNLRYIDLHSNLLRGPLPIPPNTTYVFCISNNKLTGEIPTLICNLSSLGVLDLSNNSLSGLIPQCLGNFLSVLNLGNNRFHGAFTTTFTKGNVLRNLNLNGNQIEGQVPRSLLNCEYLEVLDLGKNKINDTFPHWLETLTELMRCLSYSGFGIGPWPSSTISEAASKAHDKKMETQRLEIRNIMRCLSYSGFGIGPWPSSTIFEAASKAHDKKMETQRLKIRNMMSSRGSRGLVGSRSVGRGTIVPVTPIFATPIVGEEIACKIVRVVREALACQEVDNTHALKLTKKFLRSNPREFTGKPKPLEANNWLEQIPKTLDMLKVEIRD